MDSIIRSKIALQNLTNRIKGLTNQPDTHSMWLHWSDVATLTEAIDLLSSLEVRISALQNVAIGTNCEKHKKE